MYIAKRKPPHWLLDRLDYLPNDEIYIESIIESLEAMGVWLPLPPLFALRLYGGFSAYNAPHS